jgi:hypothetical protein
MNVNLLPRSSSKISWVSESAARKLAVSVPLRAKKASEFAALWVEAWNSQDLDLIVAHYSEGVVFSSHLLQTLAGGNSNTFGAA